MPRRMRFLLYFLVAVLVAASAFSDVFSFYDSYYSDATWSTQVGQVNKECDGSISTQWGTTSNFRIRDSLRCENSVESVDCQQLVGGAWISVSCH
jgi:Family of unknown function (DUF6289)